MANISELREFFVTCIANLNKIYFNDTDSKTVSEDAQKLLLLCSA